MYRVIILEDDPMVAAINRQYVEMNASFHIVGTFRNGQEGIQYLKRARNVDLVILDYYMPILDGMGFLEQLGKLTGLEKKPQIIMVTAANESETVQRLLGAGILDYLVKPFEYARFEQALNLFVKRQAVFEAAGSNLNQNEIDRLLKGERNHDHAALSLQKGMQEHTLQTIRQYMRDHADQSFTSEEIAEQVHLSRVTIRRYVNYMLDMHEITSGIDYQTGGRPSIKYRYAVQKP